MNRYARQERVIGREAQARLAAATVRVQSTSNVAASVEARYLAGAGVAGLSGEVAVALEDAVSLNGSVAVRRSEGEAGEAGEPALLCTTPAAADFVLGALRALATLRAASR